jgi:hypothetical protein
MRIRSMLCLLAVSLLPATLAAQAACPSLPAGSTVRLYSPAAEIHRLPQAVQPSDSVIALSDRGNAKTIRCAQLNQVQLRVGPGPRGRSTLRGMGIGLLVGAAVGATAFYLGTDETQEGEWEIIGREEAAVIGAFFTGGVGAAVGGAIGFVSPGSSWQDVPLRTRTARVPAEGVRIAPAGHAGVRMSYTVRF